MTEKVGYKLLHTIIQTAQTRSRSINRASNLVAFFAVLPIFPPIILRESPLPAPADECMNYLFTAGIRECQGDLSLSFIRQAYQLFPGTYDFNAERFSRSPLRPDGLAMFLKNQSKPENSFVSTIRSEDATHLDLGVEAYSEPCPGQASPSSKLNVSFGINTYMIMS